MNINEVMEIINGSKRYSIDGPILEITGYYTGKMIKLDLSKLTEEILEELAPDEDCEEDW